jgi:gliding motility-associated-like protein
MSIMVNVLHDFQLEPYNIISPNGDGKNDVWKIENIESYSDECRVFIYDRRGNLIAEFKNYNNDFDGSWNDKELPTGTYYYLIRCDGLADPYKGDLTIIRK